MNKIYKLIWSKVKNMWVAVAEIAKSHTKSPRSSVIGCTLVAGVLACVLGCGVAGPVWAAGDASKISSSNNNTVTGADVYEWLKKYGLYGASMIGTGPEPISSYASIGIGSGARVGALSSNSVGYSVAIGNNALTTGSYSTSIGSNAIAYGYRSVAIGAGAQALTSDAFANDNSGKSRAVAIGAGSKAMANLSVAIGDNAVAEAGKAWVVSIGANSYSGLLGSYASGYGAKSYGKNAVALGREAYTGQNSSGKIRSGAGSTATSVENVGTNAVAIGYLSAATEDNAMALGYKTEATGINAIALGSGTANTDKDFTDSITRASGQNSMAFGFNTRAASQNSIAIGGNALTGDNADSSIAIGYDSQVTGEKSIAIGLGHRVLGNNSGTFGDPNIVNGDNSYVVGNNSTVAENTSNVFVLGNNVNTTGSNTVVLGGSTDAANKLAVTGSNSVILGVGSDGSQSNVVSVGNSTSKRKVVNVADGVSATDAATVGQVRTVSEGNGIVLTETTNTNGSKNESIAVKAGTNVTVDTNGVNVVGNGAVASADTGLISGGTAYSELRPTTNGNYIATANTTAQNLGALDSALKTADNTAIKNITSSGTTVTFTKGDGTTGTFTTQDNNTEYTAGNGLELTGTEFTAKAGTNVTVDNNGINVAGNGTVADGNTGLVSGGTLFTEGRVSADANYVRASNTVAGNLSALDTAVKINADAITQINTGLEGKANTSLDNITNDGKSVIKTNAKEAINMKGSGKVTVDKTDVSGVDTYTVGVTVDGAVAEGNVGIVDGGTVYSALQAQKTTTDTALTGKANVALDNVTEAGHSVIKSDAKSAINAVDGTHTTISKRDVDGVDTYAVNVITDGTVTDGNTGIVTGGTVYAALNTEKNAREIADTALQESITAEQTARTTADTALSDRIGTLSADGNYIRQANNVSQNLSALDSAVNILSDGKADIALSNINNDGKTVVRNLAKEAVKVVNGTNTTVTEGMDGEAKTYAVNVTTDGVIAENNTGIVTGGTVYTALNAEKTARETADTTLQGNIDTEVTTRGNEDTRLAGLITAEETARIAEDTALSDRIGTLSADGNYIRRESNISQNLTALDNAVNGLSDGKANVALDNITNDGKTVVRDLAKGSVNVVGNGLASVVKTNAEGVDTYTVSVVADGEVADGNAKLVNGGVVYTAIQNAVSDLNTDVQTALAGKANVALDNVTDAGHAVIKSDAKSALNVVGGNYATVDKTDVNGVDTYTVNVATDGAVVDGNTKLVTGATVYQAIQDAKTEIDTKIANGTAYFSVNSTETPNRDGKGATGVDAMAIGDGASASGDSSAALGDYADAKGLRSIALGNSASAEKDYGIAIGGLAKVKADGGIAMGTSANVTGANAVALGNSAKAEGATSYAIGQGADAKGESSIAFGTSSESATTGVAMGHMAKATGESGVALGTATSAGKTAVAIGHGANAGAEAAMALGVNSSATQPTAVAIGMGSTATEANTVSFGNSSTKRRVVNIAEGVADSDAVAMSQLNALEETVNDGLDAKANLTLNNIDNAGKTVVRDLAKESVKVVNGTHTTVTEGTDGNAKTYAVNVTTDGEVSQNNTGIVTGGTVYDAVHAEQVARENADTALSDRIGTLSADGNYIGKDNSVSSNLSALDTQLKSNTDTIATHTTDIAELKDLSNITDAGKDVIKSYAKGAVNVIGSGKANVTKTDVSGVDTYNVEVLANGVVAENNTDIVSGGTVHTAIENAKTELSEAISNSSAKYFGVKSAGGYESNEHGEGAIGNGSIAIGTSPMAMGDNSIAVGTMSATMGDGSVAVGNSATALTDGAVAIGKNAQSPNEKTVAIGDTAVASGENSVALGANADTNNKANSVALGSGSVATDENTVSVGNTETKRRVVNVAKGTVASDAAVVEQTLEVVDGLNSKVVADGTNTIGQKKVKIDVEGLGTVAENNTALINGGTMYTELRPADGTYVKKANTTASNLSALDTQVKTNMDDITNLKDLSNITDAGKTVIKDFAKGAVNVTGSGKATVTKSEVNGVDTYNVNVTANGTVTEGNTDIVTGGAVHSAIQNAIASSEGGVATALAGKANVALDNVTEAGHNVIKSDAKSAINAIAGTHTTISKTDVDGVDTYAVNVITDGTVTDGNTGIVTGGTVYTALNTEKIAREIADTALQESITAEQTARTTADTALSDRIGTLSADGNYIRQANNVSQNLSALDSAVNILSDGKADIALSNINNDGKTVVRNLAKEAVKVVNGTNTTVTEGMDGEAKTYAVNVTTDGVIAENNTGIVTGGTVYTALNAEKTARETADTTLQGNIDTEVTTRGNEDTRLAGLITAEETARIAEDTALSDRIGTLSADGNYIRRESNISQNLTALDNAVNGLSDGKANVALDNITNDGKTVVRDLAKGSVNVVGNGLASVAKTNAEGVDTYTVSVVADGEVADGNAKLVNGGVVHTAIQNAVSDLNTDVQTALAGKANVALDNVIDAGHAVIKSDAKSVLNVVGGNYATVTKIDENGVDTYTVNVATDGEIADGNDKLVTGGTVYTAINNEKTARENADTALSDRIGTLIDDGNYVSKDASVVDNLVTLDTQLKSNTDTINTHTTNINGLKDLSNITTTGENVIRELSKGSVNVIGDGLATVSKSSTGNVDTYTVRVTANGAVAEDNEGIVTGGDVYDAIDVAVNEVSNVVGIKANADASNIGRYNAGGDNSSQWGAALGTDAIEMGNFRLVTSQGMFEELRPTNGSYITGDKSVAENLSQLDTQVKTNADTISDLAGTVVRYDSADKESVTLGTPSTAKVKVTNVAEGTLSATSTDAVNGSQLYQTNQAVNKEKEDRENADTEISNRIGTMSSDGEYVNKDDSVSSNLTALDRNLKSVSDSISSFGDLGSLTDTGRDVIRTLSKESVKVIDGTNTTVTKGIDGNADTYAVNVTVDGSVTQGNEGLVKGGDIYEAIQSAIASGTPDALTSKANTDLSNLNDDGKKEVRNLAKDAVNVKGENGINVTQVTSEGPDGVTKEFTATLLKATGVEQGNTNVVDSGTMFSELRPADGDYVAQSNTTAQNLSALDTALKSVNDTVEANYNSLNGAMGTKMNVSLSNITDSGKETLRKIARSSVKVESSDGSVDVEASNVDVYDAYGSHALYDISVKKDGAVVNGNTGIVTGGTVAAETRVASDGEYVRTANSAGENIRLLDTALKSVADLAQQSAEVGRDANAVHYDSVAKDTVSLAGADGTVITNLKDGAVSADSKDAVTGKQLYGVKETAEQAARDVQSLYDTVGDLQDGSYISSSETVGNNLKSLDAQVKSNTDALNSLQDGINSSINELQDGKADTDLGNLSDAGKDVIRNLAGDAVDVVSSDNTLSVSSSTAEGVKTFDLSVKKDGEVVAGNTGIVTGGTVYEAIQNVTVSDEHIREVLGDSLDSKADAGLGNLTEEGKDVIRETVRPELDKKANVDASNIDVQKWTDTLGTGKVEEGNGNLVRGGEVYDAIRKIDVNNGMIQSSDGVVRIGANDASEIVDFTNSEGSGRVLRGVVTDISDKTSAANVGYVDAMNRNVLANVNDGLSRMDKKINKVGAGVAAMASLAPMPFDSDQKWSISAAVGTYKGETSGAIGAFYRPLDNVMLNIRGAVGNGENMVGAGVTIGLNKGGATGLSKAQMVRAMNAQANEIIAQKEMIQSQQEQLELQKQQIEELKAMFEDMKKAK